MLISSDQKVSDKDVVFQLHNTQTSVTGVIAEPNLSLFHK